MLTMDEEEINIENYWHYLKFFKHNRHHICYKIKRMKQIV